MQSNDPHSLYDILGQLIENVFVAETEADVYRAVAKYLPLLIPADRVSVALVIPTGDEIEVFALGGLTSDFAIGTRLPCDDSSNAGQVLLTQQSRLFTVTPDSPDRVHAQLAREGIVRVMNTPLIIADCSFGVLNVASRQKDAYGQKELSILKQIATLISTYIERLRLIQQSQIAMKRHRNYAERLEILNEMGRRLSSAKKEGEIFQIVLEAIESVLGAERVSYVIPNPDGVSCQICALVGNNIIPKAHNYPLEGSGIEAVINQGQPLAFPDLSASDYQEHTLLVSQGLCMGWSVPILVTGKIVGILNAATSTPWTFPDEALTFLNALGRFMGTTLERIYAQKEVDTTLQKLEHQVSHDLLTGLPNRSCFEETLTQEISNSPSPTQARHAILFVDLDGFKQVNDSLSHSIGDQLLCDVAQRLSQQLSPQDIVARMGGDEFVILLRNILSPAQVLNVGQRLLKALSSPFNVEQHHIQIGGSIGVSLFPEHGQSSDVLMKHADIAMYAAKAKGRNNCQMYTTQMSEQLELRLTLERDLRKAIAQKEFFLMFQPQIEVSHGKVSAIESLIRWNHPEWGIMSPGRFIQVAEEAGLIGEITAWVLDQSLETLASLHARYPDLYISVNISAQDLLSPIVFIEQVLDTLNKYSLPGKVLELELTESVFLDYAETVSDVIKTLKEHGIRLAIDDFGTGFSSLNYLLNLPMDTLKIDRTFVQSIHTDSRTQGIVKTILALGENLDVISVAEGVEEEAQLNCLTALGCQKIQGFLIAKPMSIKELKAFLKQQSSTSEAS